MSLTCASDKDAHPCRNCLSGAFALSDCTPKRYRTLSQITCVLRCTISFRLASHRRLDSNDSAASGSSRHRGDVRRPDVRVVQRVAEDPDTPNGAIVVKTIAPFGQAGDST
jgi:hypothetical protein